MSTAKSLTTVGDRVKLRNYGLLGTVKFVGSLQGKKCIYYGIDLDESNGQNDGSIKGHYYFKTQKNKGLFVKKSAILKTNKKKNAKAPRVTVGYKVWIAKAKCYATMRWIGTLQFQIMRNDIFYGIELESQRGENNGTLYNFWYFTAQEKHGLFVRAHDLTIIMQPQKITPQLSDLSRLSKLSELNDNSNVSYASVLSEKELKDEFEKNMKLCVFKVCFFSDAVQYCKLKPKDITLYCLQLGYIPKMGDTVLISSQPSYNEDIILRNIVHHALRNIHCFSSYCYYQKLLQSENITLNQADDMLEYYSAVLNTEPNLQNVHKLQLLNSVTSSEEHIGQETMHNICNVTCTMKDKSIFDGQNQEMAISIYDSFVTDVQKMLVLKDPFLSDIIRLFPIAIYHFFDYLLSLKKNNQKLECLQLQKSNLKAFIYEDSVIFHESIIFLSMSIENTLEKYIETKNEHTLSSLSSPIQFALQERLELLLSGYMRKITEFNPSDIVQVINTFYMIAV